MPYLLIHISYIQTCARSPNETTEPYRVMQSLIVAATRRNCRSCWSSWRREIDKSITHTHTRLYYRRLYRVLLAFWESLQGSCTAEATAAGLDTKPTYSSLYIYSGPNKKRRSCTSATARDTTRPIHIIHLSICRLFFFFFFLFC